VDDRDYQVPFAFTGRIVKITVDLGEGSVTPEAVRAFAEAMAARARDAERPAPGAARTAPAAAPPAATPPAAAQPPRR
jgi:pyruvate/2-oxoglutarate dehydrogenase complex dihydrolipoamide acyltransferase (E2) component